MKSKKLFYIGLSAIVALLVLVFGIDFLKGINLFHTSNYYYVSYESVAGLNVSAPVTANGFKVGQVREMNYEFDNPGHVRVEIAIDPALKVPDGTVAVLGSDLLGTATIALEMPKNTNYVKVGSEIPGKMAGGLMESVQTGLMPAVTGVMPKVDSLLTALTAIASDPSLAATLSRLDRISADLSVVSANLAAASKGMPAVMTNVDQLTGNLSSAAVRLDTLTERIDRMPLEQTVGNIERLTANLKALSEQLREPDSTLGMLINDPSLYQSLNNTVGSLDSLIVDLKAHPKRYLKFSVF